MLINRKKVKEFALEMAKHRAHKFTRVGSGVPHQVRGEPQDVHSQPGPQPALQRQNHHLKAEPSGSPFLSPEPAMPKRCGWLLHFNINNNQRKERIHEQRNRNPRV